MGDIESMALEYDPTKIQSSVSEGDNLRLDQIPTADTPESRKQKPPLVEILWTNVVKYALLHVGALYGFTRIPSSHPFTWLWTIFYFLFTALGITAGAHRLWSHHSYKAKTPLRILLALMNSAALQRDIIDWVHYHRVHHKFSETNADPHNAKRGFFFAHVGWLMVREHPEVIRKMESTDLSDLYADEVVMMQRRYYNSSVLLMCILVPTVVPWYFWGESLYNGFFLATVLRYALLLNASWFVNSAAHMWGNRPYDKNISPAENPWVTFFASGEGFHNYHHVFPQDYATSEFGRHMNLTTAFIDFFACLGLVTDRKKMSSLIIEKRKQRTGDSFSNT